MVFFLTTTVKKNICICICVYKVQMSNTDSLRKRVIEYYMAIWKSTWQLGHYFAYSREELEKKKITQLFWKRLLHIDLQFLKLCTLLLALMVTLTYLSYSKHLKKKVFFTACKWMAFGNTEWAWHKSTLAGSLHVCVMC